MKERTIRVYQKRIFVGLSGGVDSAVTAALLQEAGAEVTGVFIKGWYPSELPCTWAEDRRDAMRVAAHLEIPFYTLDASREYKKSVIDYLIREYKAGNTPNPDIMCNKDVKFGAFYAFAKEKGAGLIATGHYARVENGHLYRGIDSAKDQSYFLWAVGEKTLENVVFPLGGKTKTEVRMLAKKYNLPVAEKKDSQGICFLGPVAIDDFLRAEFETSRGEAYDEQGKNIGTHESALLYTLGERVELRDAPPGPWYVLTKDVEKNTLIVGKERKVNMTVKNIRLEEVNLLEKVNEKEILEAQYRYHGPVIKGQYAQNLFTPLQDLSEPIASGQSLVLYLNSECVGGGIIRE